MSAPDDATLLKALRQGLGAMPFASALGVEVVSASPGSATLEVPLSPALEAPPGAFAASSVGVVGDMAAILSVTSALPAGNFVSTMDFTIKMLGTAQGTRLRAVGAVKQIGKTTCIGAAEISVLNGDTWTPCGTLLATGRRLYLDKTSGKAS
ncbi:MAG: PaaI family thioesterase [Sulfitobacter sp.]|nr:PaaI family thioesterase [Sulfitobacter sp.]